MKSFIIFLILGLIWREALAIDFTCDPTADCEEAGYSGATVPDPDDCESYYVCLRKSDGTFVPTPNSVKCPDGQYFNQESNGCFEETTPGSCVNECVGSGSPSCATVCPDTFASVTYAADKSNCSYFTVCLEPGGLSEVCPTATPYFNGIKCVADKDQCCDFCTPYCFSVGGQIQDPCDCTSFYICIEIGIPSVKFSCGSGFYYDEVASECLAGSCTSLCAGSQCGSTSVTTTTEGSAVTTTTEGSAITTTTEGSDVTTTTGGSVETTTTPTDGCTPLASFTCPSDGNFPRCPRCVQSYFHCSNGVPEIAYCQGVQVFNTNPLYPYCLDPTNCPF